ncbi:MAG: CCA tRNA nucleotidyltransferase, partial [Alphaproteobacteria bacterium]
MAKQAEQIHRLLNQPIVKAATQILGSENVRLVGGAVRDLCVGIEPADLDMATSLLPNQVIQLLEDAGHKTIPTGLAHGTITLLLNNVPLEITTLRKDVSTDGRRATVAFTDDWKEDALRRDFTFNALALTSHGELVDYFGGEADLKAGHVRFVGDARQRIHEDHLRLLRYFRFYARFGKQAPSQDLQAILTQEAPKLLTLSAERIQKEILSLLPLQQAAKSLTLMSALGIDNLLFGYRFNMDAFNTLCGFEHQFDQPDPLRRLAALLDRNEVAMEHTCQRLKLSNTDKKRFRFMSQNRSSLITHPLHEALYKSGAQAVVDDLLLQNKIDHHALEKANNWMRPVFPVTGQDL